MVQQHDMHKPNDSVDEHVQYWQKRAAEQGKRCVVHCSHSQKDADTEAAILATHFGVALAGMKKRKCFPVGSSVLDFGCGWGRWTRFLADATGAFVTGVDLAPAHIEKANPSEKTAFTLRENPMSSLPFADCSLDLIFTCTVLQHLVRSEILQYTLNEFNRVLMPGGKLLMFEATEKMAAKNHIRFNTVEAYRKLMPWAKIEAGWQHVIRGEEHTLMLGVRR